jgi:ferredoxin
MEYKVIAKQNFASLVNNLAREVDVVGVKRKDGKYDFGNITSSDELCLDYDVTVMSPKKYFLPPQETLLKFKLGAEIEVEPVLKAIPLVIIGIHPYDIKAIELLDKAFTITNPDPNYISRRQNTTIIGVDCLNPSPNAFCPSMGTATTETGFDLLLTNIGNDEYVVAIGSTKGEELLNKYAQTRDANEEDLAKRKAAQEAAIAKYQLSLNLPWEELPTLLDKSYDSPYWQTKGESCLSCGSCVMVCPTCFCFDVQDDVELNLTEGERFRRWDGCMLLDFAAVAGGGNFRKDKSARLRHRIYRKGKYIHERYGQMGCVGCGRCATACLASIASPLEAFNALKEEALSG